MSDNERHRGEDRLQEIDRRIERMRDEKAERQAPERHALPAGAGAILGRVATELVAGVMVGTFIGWALDRWLETSPLFLVMLFFPRCRRRHAECLANGVWPGYGDWVL